MGNKTQRHTEFLGVLSDRRVDASVLQQPLQTFCQQRPVYWTRRAGGERSPTNTTSKKNAKNLLALIIFNTLLLLFERQTMECLKGLCWQASQVQEHIA